MEMRNYLRSDIFIGHRGAESAEFIVVSNVCETAFTHDEY